MFADTEICLAEDGLDATLIVFIDENVFKKVKSCSK